MASRSLRYAGILLFTLLSFANVNAQNHHYQNGVLDIDIFAFNPCGGSANGYLAFKVNNATGGASGSAKIIALFTPIGNFFSFPSMPVGSTYIFNAGHTLPAGSYTFIITDDNDNSLVINSPSPDPAIVMTALPNITITDDPSVNLTNTSCANPDGKIMFSIAGGSKVLAGGGSFNYTITSTNGVSGFPLTGTWDGSTPLDVTTLHNASNPAISGLPGGTYQLTLVDNYSSTACGGFKSWTITDPSPLTYNTSSTTPAVCLGATGTIQLSGSEGSSVVYEIYKGGVATGVTLNGTGSPLNFSIPPALLTPVGTYTFTVFASNGLCSPKFMNLSGSIVVNPLPVPTITGASPVCVASTGVSYSTETGKSAYVWTITGGVITSGAGTSSVLVTWNTSGAQSISVNYQDSNGCAAATPTTKPITVNPNPVPTITGSASVCIGSTGNAYSTETSKTGYVWSVTGGTITSGAGTSAIAVTWTTAGPQSVSVNYSDVNGCTATTPTVKPISVNALPVPTISGSASACLNATSTYTTEIGNSGYVWTVSAGGTIASGAGTGSIDVTWTTTGVKTVSVTYVDANGCSPSAATNKSVTVNPLPTPTVTGPNAACAGSAGLAYSTEVANSGYVWTISPGGTITSGAGTSAITVTWNTAGPQNVSVNYNDVNGCTAASPTVFNVTVNPLPVPTITGAPIVCVGATGISYATEAGNTGYSWTVSGGTIATGLGTNTITVNWTGTGAQTVTVNYNDVNGCTAATPTSLPITVNALPVPTITGNLSACINSTSNIYTTESGNTAYNWNVVGGTINSGAGTNSIAVTWTTAGSQNVSVNYTNINGCTAATATVQAVTVNPLPLPTITGSTSVCVNATSVVYFTEAGKTGYLWTVSGGAITSGLGTNSITVDWTLAGSEQVTVNYADVNGCSATTATVKPVTVNALPVPVITGSGSVCVTSTGNSYSTAAGNSGYVWTVSSGGVITAGLGTNIISVTWNTAGPQVVTVNYTDPNGCAAASATSKPVTVNVLPVPTITGPLSACAGSTTNSYATDPGNSAYVWNIVGGTITSGAGTPSVTVTWTVIGSQNISVSYTDPNGCASSSPTVQPVNVIAQPVPTITGTTSVCVGSTGVTYATEAGKTGYSWTVSGATIVSGVGTNMITVDWTAGGPQNVSVNYTDVSGCTAATPTNLAVNVNVLPAPTITGNATACLNSSGNTYVTEPGNAGYVWTVSAGGVINSGAGTSAISVTWTGSGNQLVTVTYVDGNGCSPAAATNKTVFVNDLPVATVTGATAVCAGSTNIAYSTETGESGYLWTVTNGTITSGAGTSSITVDWPTLGAGTVAVTYSDVNGCSPSTPASLPVTINTTPDASINPAGPFCSSPSSVALTAVNSGGTWSGTGILDTTLGTFDITTAGTFVISYTITSGSCSDTKSISIVVNPTPDATIAPAGPFCISDPSSNLTAATSGGTWSGTGITDATLGTFSPALAGAGTFTITYTITTGGCTGTKTLDITVGNPPDATITPVGPFCSNDIALTLTAATAGGTWSGTGITDAVNGLFDPKTAVVGTNTIAYTITIGGCSDTKSTSIVVNQAPDATITNAGPFCISDAAVNLAAASPGGTWSGSGITDGTLGTFDPATAGVGTFVITYSVSNASCTDTKTISITVANPPDATITTVGPYCSNAGVVTLAAVTSGGTWVGTGITDPVAGTFDTSTSGTFTITYSITIGGCSDTNSTDIVVNPAPSATINPAGPFCTSDGPQTLSGVTAGGTWSGTGILSPTLGTFDTSTAGTFTITYSVTNAGCTDTQTRDILVSNPPDATIAPQGALCTNSPPVTLTSATPGGTWSGPGITDPVAGIFDPSQAGGQGAFTITYTVAIGSCTDTKTISIVINCGNPANGCLAVAGVVQDILPSCNIQTDGQITVIMTKGTGPFVVTLATPGFSQGLTGNGPNFVFPNLLPADYQYTMTDALNNTCTLPWTLKLQTGVVASASNFVDAKCADGLGAATLAVQSGGTSPYEYSIDAGSSWVSFTSPVTINNLKATNSVASILVRDDAADLCQTEVLVTINGPLDALDTLYATPTVSFPDLATGTLLVGVKESGNPNYYASLELITPLFPDQTFVEDSVKVPFNTANLRYEYQFNDLYAGVYKLTLTDAGGCDKQYAITIPLDNKIFIPNIFTPNGDKKNPYFYIRNLPANTSVIITNRWGKEVFSSKDYKNDWDAEGNAEGVYYYRILADGQTFTGWVEVLRGQ